MKRYVICVLGMVLLLTMFTYANNTSETLAAGSVKAIQEITVEKIEKGNVKKVKNDVTPTKKKKGKKAAVSKKAAKDIDVLASKEHKEVPEEKKEGYTEEEIKEICRTVNEEIAKCVYAEAGNQSEYGKRLVCDVILNRVDSNQFPDSYHNVIAQPYQFSVYWSDAMSSACPDEETYIVVYEELQNRTNDEVLYFCTGNYFSWATPVLKEGAHYFAK